MNHSGEGRPFFRGAEFSRLLILGGLLVAGVPLAIYYGYQKRSQPPEPKLNAADIPPLPPADADPAFALVRDDKPREVRDDDALELLVRRVRDDKPPGLAQSARRELTPTDLILRPKRYRGLPVRLEGYARQVFTVDDQDKSVVPTGRFYEVWFNQDRDIKTLPCVLWTDHVPPTLPAGQGLNERIAVEAYFLKLLAFPGGNGKPYHAPLFIGRIVHEPAFTGGGAKVDRSPSWMFWPLGLLIAYVAVRLLFVVRKAMRPKPAIRKTNAPLDQIDPEDLGRWLESAPRDEAPGECSWTEPPRRV